MAEAVALFQSSLQVSRPDRDADLIAVQVRASDPGQAAAAANLLTQQLISGRHGVQLARTGSTIDFLKHQLDTLGTQLRRAEDALRAYRERAGVVDAEEEARTQVRRLADIEADRGAVEAERQALALLVRQMRSDSARALPGGQAKSRGLISFPTLFKNAAASELLAALAQVENERSALLVRRKPEDPDVQVLTARIRELDAQLQGIAETYLQGLTNQVGALREVARGFGGALNTLPKKEVAGGPTGARGQGSAGSLHPDPDPPQGSGDHPGDGGSECPHSRPGGRAQRSRGPQTAAQPGALCGGRFAAWGNNRARSGADRPIGPHARRCTAGRWAPCPRGNSAAGTSTVKLLPRTTQRRTRPSVPSSVGTFFGSRGST